MDDRKSNNRLVSLDDDDNSIAVDSFTFPFEIWSQLIPIVYKKCLELLEQIFVEGQDWKASVLEAPVVSVTSNDSGDLFVGADSDDDFEIKEDYDATLVDMLMAFLQLALLGLGGGSTRGTEANQLKTRNSRWHRGSLYYWCWSNKRGSLVKKKNKKKKEVVIRSSNKGEEHKLCQLLGRIYLMSRMVVRSWDDLDDKYAAPMRPTTKYTLTSAVAEIFGFETRPEITQVRQFFVAITSCYFSNSELSLSLSAVGEAAEMSHHTEETGRKSYATEVLNGRERIYKLYHRALGDTGSLGVNIASGTADRVGPQDLLAALHLMFAGTNVSYTSRRPAPPS